MRHIYFDESGTSRSEPTAFVAGVIVNPDTQYRSIEHAIENAKKELIPDDGGTEFIFHATEIFTTYRRRYGWDIERCNRVIARWLKIIVDHELCPVVGWWEKEVGDQGKATREENNFAHIMSFAIALATADGIVRAVFPSETSSVFAEEHHELQKKLQRMSIRMQRGDIPKIPYLRPVESMVEGISFLRKDQSAMLQLADTFAFSFRRFYNGLAGGERLYHALWGEPSIMFGPTFQRKPFGRFLIAPDSLRTQLQTVLDTKLGFVHFRP